MSSIWASLAFPAHRPARRQIRTAVSVALALAAGLFLALMTWTQEGAVAAGLPSASAPSRPQCSGARTPPPEPVLSVSDAAELRTAVRADDFGASALYRTSGRSRSTAVHVPPADAIPSEVGATTFYYSWATGYQRIPCSAHMDGVWEMQQNAQPVVPAGAAHSLGQLWAISRRGSCMSDVETGWMVSPQQYGDDQPHLFMYAWDCGVGLGYVGQSSIPWTQYSGVVAPGATLVHGSALHMYGVALKAGNWWFDYDGQWVGYIPASAWTRMFPAPIDEVRIGGEVASTAPEPCITMGNDGLYGDSAGAALVGDVWTQREAVKTEAALLDYSNDAEYSTGGWSRGMPGSRFRYGGPGWCGEEAGS
jgi:Neprosin